MAVTGSWSGAIVGGLPFGAGLVLARGCSGRLLVLAALAVAIALRAELSWRRLVFRSGFGFAFALGWTLTTTLSQRAFDPVQIESVTFTGPSANTLMFFLDQSSRWEFDTGLVPGVFLGAFHAAAFTRELRFQGSKGPHPCATP